MPKRVVPGGMEAGGLSAAVSVEPKFGAASGSAAVAGPGVSPPSSSGGDGSPGLASAAASPDGAGAAALVSCRLWLVARLIDGDRRWGWRRGADRWLRQLAGLAIGVFGSGDGAEVVTEGRAWQRRHRTQHPFSGLSRELSAVTLARQVLHRGPEFADLRSLASLPGSRPRLAAQREPTAPEEGAGGADGADIAGVRGGACRRRTRSAAPVAR